ncbi:MAG: hypothetical protein CL917_02885 [Deltaproteobacteria bacterium]|nr:hypothetical protein [Deltaproteobacteria bacterium]
MGSGQEGEERWLRVLYWGARGAGKTTTLRVLHEKLNPQKTGEFRSLPTRLDPTLTYEQFPIHLGMVAGSESKLVVTAVPGAPEAAQTRKHLLDRTDGLVFVCDSRPEAKGETLRSLTELRESLAAYGRSPEDLPIAIQYNKRDLAEAFDLEALHREIGLSEAAVFETVATEAIGTLEALSAVSKSVVRTFKKQRVTSTPSSESSVGSTTSRDSKLPNTEPAPPSSITDLMEAAILAEANDPEADELDSLLSHTQVSLNRSWSDVERDTKASSGIRFTDDLKIISVGTASKSGVRGVSVPIVLGNDDGESVSLALTISLDPILDEI